MKGIQWSLSHLFDTSDRVQHNIRCFAKLFNDLVSGHYYMLVVCLRDVEYPRLMLCIEFRHPYAAVDSLLDAYLVISNLNPFSCMFVELDHINVQGYQASIADFWDHILIFC